MTTKVAKLQRASLTNPIKVEVASKFVNSLSFAPFCHSYLVYRYQTVDTLLQYYLLMPFIDKQAYFIYLVHSLAGNSIIVFTRTKSEAQMCVIMSCYNGSSLTAILGFLSCSASLALLLYLFMGI